METIESVLDLGVDQAIIGTRAATDPGFLARALETYQGRILVSIDARDGMVALEGWTRSGNRSAADLARELRTLGLQTAVVTDVRRDGTLTGPNLGLLTSILDTGLRVIAAGGVSSLDHLRRLQTLEEAGLVGAVVGKAIYTGDLDLEAALKLFSNPGTDQGAEFSGAGSEV